MGPGRAGRPAIRAAAGTRSRGEDTLVGRTSCVEPSIVGLQGYLCHSLVKSADPTGSQYTYVHRPYLRRHYLPRDELHDDEEL